jgi:hypothetical protein
VFVLRKEGRNFIMMQNKKPCANYAQRAKQMQYRHYGIIGYGVLRPGIQNYKDFFIRTNIPKGNYRIKVV